MAVVATLSKGYDLDYIWRRSTATRRRTRPAITSRPAKAAGSRRAAGGARAPKRSASSSARWSSASRMTCCSANARPRTGPRWAGRRAAAAKPPTSTPGCWRPSRTPPPSASTSCGSKRPQARQSPLFFDLTVSLSKSISIFHASLGENARQAHQAGDQAGEAYWSGLVAEVDDMIWQAVLGRV